MSSNNPKPSGETLHHGPSAKRSVLNTCFKGFISMFPSERLFMKLVCMRLQDHSPLRPAPLGSVRRCGVLSFPPEPRRPEPWRCPERRRGAA